MIAGQIVKVFSSFSLISSFHQAQLFKSSVSCYPCLFEAVNCVESPHYKRFLVLIKSYLTSFVLSKLSGGYFSFIME